MNAINKPPGAPGGLVLPGGTWDNPLAFGRPGLPTVVNVPTSPMRPGAAAAMEYARKNTVPVSTVAEVDMSRLMELHPRNKQAVAPMGIPLTYSAYFARATVKGLQAHPLMNAAMTGHNYLIPRYVHLGVATQTPGCVLIPIIQNAESKGTLDLAREIYLNTERALRGELTGEEMSGYTFVITNPGRWGRTLFGTPIIAPGNAGILSFETIQKRPVVDEDDEIVARPMMYVVLTADHRIVDGQEMIGFLGEVKRVLEQADL